MKKRDIESQSKPPKATACFSCRPSPCEHRFFCVALVPELKEDNPPLESGLRELPACTPTLIFCVQRAVALENTNTLEAKRDGVCPHLQVVPGLYQNFTCLISYTVRNRFGSNARLIQKLISRTGRGGRHVKEERAAGDGQDRRDGWRRRAEEDGVPKVLCYDMIRHNLKETGKKRITNTKEESNMLSTLCKKTHGALMEPWPALFSLPIVHRAFHTERMAHWEA